MQGRYIGGGKLDPTLVGPGDQYYDPASPISIASNRVEGRAYLDLSLQIDVIKEARRRMQVYFVANNVTDAGAPFPVIAIAGQYDRIGRYFRRRPLRLLTERDNPPRRASFERIKRPFGPRNRLNGRVVSGASVPGVVT